MLERQTSCVYHTQRNPERYDQHSSPSHRSNVICEPSARLARFVARQCVRPCTPPPTCVHVSSPSLRLFFPRCTRAHPRADAARSSASHARSLQRCAHDASTHTRQEGNQLRRTRVWRMEWRSRGRRSKRALVALTALALAFAVRLPLVPSASRAPLSRIASHPLSRRFN